MEEMKSVMISVNPPYPDMMIQGIKKTEFRGRIIGSVEPGTRVYLYETKNKGGMGRVTAKAVVADVVSIASPEAMPVLYEQFISVALKLGQEVSRETFAWYLESIGYGGRYGIVLSGLEECDYQLSMFECNGKQMKRPPQNMCTCRLIQEKHGQKSQKVFVPVPG